MGRKCVFHCLKIASRGKGADYPGTWVCKVYLDAFISFHLILSFCIICIISEITFGVYVKLWVRNNKPTSEFCFESSQALSSTSDFIYRYLITFYTFVVPLIAWYHLLRKHSTYWILSGSFHFRCLGPNIRSCTFFLLNSTTCPPFTIYFQIPMWLIPSTCDYLSNIIWTLRKLILIALHPFQLSLYPARFSTYIWLL